MVQYILTPWRDRHELLLVRRQFYGGGDGRNTATNTGLAGLAGHQHPLIQLEVTGTSHGIRRPTTSITPHQQGQHSSQQQGHHHHQEEEQEEEGSHQDLLQAQDQAQTQSESARRKKRHHHAAVARVSMWMQRGNCPHMVESTALLMAAVLSDQDASQHDDPTTSTTTSNITSTSNPTSQVRAASSAYAARAAYAAAFSRFVTGLLDGHQDKQRKQSMYSLAKTIGLPATFVELRHQSTHEQLPSLAKLRSAARKALLWIWEYYWQHLGPEDDPEDSQHDEPGAAKGTSGAGISIGRGTGLGESIGAADIASCDTAILQYLRQGNDGEKEQKALEQLLRTWDRQTLLQSLAGLQGRLTGNQAYLRCLRLSKRLQEEGDKKDEQVLSGGSNPAGIPREAGARAAGDGQQDPAGAAREAPEPDSASDFGWVQHQGPWKPKPIGIV